MSTSLTSIKPISYQFGMPTKDHIPSCIFGNTWKYVSHQEKPTVIYTVAINSLDIKFISTVFLPAFYQNIYETTHQFRFFKSGKCPSDIHKYDIL